MRVRRMSFAIVAISVIAVVGGCGSSTTTQSSGTTAASATAGSGTTAKPSGSSTTSGTKPTATGAIVIKVVQTPYGPALGSADGRVLYAWDKEASGTIQCSATACTDKWPPLVGASVTGDGIQTTGLTLVTRPDGTQQAALDGKPLYNMAIDAPGEANCQGAEGWWIYKPDGTKNTSTTPS